MARSSPEVVFHRGDGSEKSLADTVMAFLATRDGSRARAFYEGTLGFDVHSDDDFALALDSAGTKLRVQKVAAFEPQPFTALGWDVTDVEATVAELGRRGGKAERRPDSLVQRPGRQHAVDRTALTSPPYSLFHGDRAIGSIFLAPLIIFRSRGN
jgi:hypothetical protein